MAAAHALDLLQMCAPARFGVAVHPLSTVQHQLIDSIW
jgi:hypothetical protein